jgi:hypothetical protein
MSLKAKRMISVYFFALTALSLGLGMVSLRHFSLIGWLLLSLQVELGILIFSLMIIGIIVGCGWAITGDAHQSFISYLKYIVKNALG